MTVVPRPDTLATELATLKNRLLALETSAGLSNAAIDGGALTVYDNTLVPRVVLGLLPDGTYGLAIGSNVAVGGHYVDIHVPAYTALGGPFTTASTTPTTIAGSPTLNVTVGASGLCLITLSAFVGLSLTSAGAIEGNAEITIDGVTGGTVITSSLTLQAAALPGGMANSVSSTFLKGSLSQGTHTLGLVYSSTFGQSISWSNVGIAALPY